MFFRAVGFFQKAPTALKNILALIIWGQIGTVSVVQPFRFDFYGTEHPVPNFVKEAKGTRKFLSSLKQVTSFYVT